MTEQGGEPRASAAVDGLPRREFLKRGAIAGGAFGGAWALPALIRDAYGDPIPIPHAARSVEGGLAAFAARWQVAGPAVKLTRFGDFLSDKTFNCRVAGTPRSYVLKLGTVGATLNPGIDPQRHADMVMPEADWLGVLYGDYSGFAALMYGECFPPRSGANSVALLGIVMYAFSFIPAGANPDPKLLVGTSVASFAHLLRNSSTKGTASYDSVLELAGEGLSFDPGGYRKEFVDLVAKAKALAVSRGSCPSCGK